jgi:hypothetical protein
MGGRCVRYGWIGGRREKVRGLYGFSSLVKQNKKGKNCAVFCFAGKRNFFFYIYDVITWGEKKSSANHYYSCAMRYDEQASRTLRRNVVSHRGSSSSAIGVTSAGAHLSTNSEQRRVRGKKYEGAKDSPHRRAAEDDPMTTEHDVPHWARPVTAHSHPSAWVSHDICTRP